MNRNLKFAAVGVIIAAVMAFGVVATIGFIAPAHAQGNMTAGGNATGGNMTGGNMTGGNMTGGNMTKK
jgi:hypothetical protein